MVASESSRAPMRFFDLPRNGMMIRLVTARPMPSQLVAGCSPCASLVMAS